MTEASLRALINRASDLLSACASQPTWEFGCRTIPGFDLPSREMAELALRSSPHSTDDDFVEDAWRLGYADAESRLRAVAR